MLGFFLFPTHINIIEIFVSFNHFASTLNHFNTSKKKKERKICGLKKDKNPLSPPKKKVVCISGVSVCGCVIYWLLDIHTTQPAGFFLPTSWCHEFIDYRTLFIKLCSFLMSLSMLALWARSACTVGSHFVMLVSTSVFACLVRWTKEWKSKEKRLCVF